LEEYIQMLKKSYDHIKDAEINPTDHSGETLPLYSINRCINLSLKLLWCTHTMLMQKKK
jgi:hypothetical protein